ncbi:odorant receptor 9a-like [Harpegnathos saltator]|uniref:odorant receptor 9a-like n=1 Tax=Harpegnathos saltator TaxID=610380 RepID=UPI000948980C|nr:odorant receptor 9a-like [Harpegnathos saltator]
MYCFFNKIQCNLPQYKRNIKCDWDMLRDSAEIEIMMKQADTTRWYIKFFARKRPSCIKQIRSTSQQLIKQKSHRHLIFFAVIMYIFLFLFVATNYLPLILDVVIPLDKPRPRKLLTHLEVFIDQHKYFHFIMLFIIIASFFGITTVLAAETMLMIFIQHACGLFKVTSYRMMRAFDISSVPAINYSKKCTICNRLASAMKIHRTAILFSERITLYLANNYFVLILCAVVSLSSNLYRLTQALAVMKIMDMFIIFVFICGHFCYMFWCNYAGQELMNSSTEVYHQVYNSQWYKSPVHNQKMMILILCRSAKPCTFVVGHLFLTSLEGFGTLISMSLSYFTVIYSTQ